MRFKTWFENLAGPGGGPENHADSPEKIGQDDFRHGVGAYPTFGSDPPRNGRSPLARYIDPRFARQGMKKKMKKG